jgi:hypothetical protein
MEATTPADHDMEGALAPGVIPASVLYLNSRRIFYPVGRTQQKRPWRNWIRGTAKTALCGEEKRNLNRRVRVLVASQPAWHITTQHGP